MAKTYEPIASTVITSATGTVTFSSIPGTFTDLICMGVVKGAASYGLRMRFNSDSGTNYSSTYLYGNGSTALSGRESSAASTYASLDVDTTDAGNFVVHLMSYANTSVYKTILTSGVDGGYVGRTVGLWRSTSAITSVSIALGNSFPSGNISTATISLYGIKAA